MSSRKRSFFSSIEDGFYESITEQLVERRIIAPDQAPAVARGVVVAVATSCDGALPCRGARLWSPAEFVAHREIVAGHPDPEAPMELLVGRLRTCTAQRMPLADTGALLLCDESGESKLLCSTCTTSVPSPAQLEALVLFTSWAFIPECIDASSTAPYIELRGQASTLLGVPPPQLPSSLSTSDAWQTVISREHAKMLITLRGTLTAVSEPFGTREPVFFAELSACSEDDGSSSNGGGLVLPIAFLGVQAARWRCVLETEREYVITNLRRADQFADDGDTLAVLRSSTDDRTNAATVVHLVDAPSRADRGPSQTFGGCAGRSSQASQRLYAASQVPVLDYEQLRSQSQRWGSHAAPMLASRQQASQQQASQPPQASALPASAPASEDYNIKRPELVNYDGVLTRWLSPCVLEMDGEYKVFLAHSATQSRRGVRVGAKLRIADAHVLHAPTDEQCGAASRPSFDGEVAAHGWPLAGFGLCARGSLRVIEHAPLDALKGTAAAAAAASSQRAAAANSEHTHALRRLAKQLNLAELAACHERLLSPGTAEAGVLAGVAAGVAAGAGAGAGWAARWAHVLSAAEAEEALCRLLSAHGLTELRPEPGLRWQCCGQHAPTRGTELHAPRLAEALHAHRRTSFSRAELSKLGVRSVHATNYVVVTTPRSGSGGGAATAAAPAADAPASATFYAPMPCGRAHRNAYREFICHAAECHLAVSRAPLPMPPMLGRALEVLRALAPVRSAMEHVRSTAQPQLLLDVHLGVTRPCLVGKVQEEAAFTLSQDAAPTGWRLTDATSELRLLLPHSDPPSVRCGVWALSRCAPAPRRQAKAGDAQPHRSIASRHA